MSSRRQIDSQARDGARRGDALVARGTEALEPTERTPTRIMRAQEARQAGRRAGRRTGPLRWLHSLRWRLTLTYVGLLVILLAALGVSLNALISRTLYSDEFSRIASDARSSLLANQRDFDSAVRGTRADCADALSYQQAFQQIIVRRLVSGHGSIGHVYLLDTNGIALASDDAAAVGASGPDVTPARVAQVRAKMLGFRTNGSAYFVRDTSKIPPVTYTVKQVDGQSTGVVLIAERFYTTSKCINPSANQGENGIIEVTTGFPRTPMVLTRLRALLVITFGGVALLGLLIGGALTAGALRPLTRMTQVARKIASGDLSQRVRLPHSGDEIGQLADTFNEMVARIEYAFAIQRASEDRMRQFIADASHELRTPLTSIRGYTDVLLRGAKDDPATVEQVLLATRRESERMSRLVNDLLTLARLDAGRPLDLAPLDVVALVGEGVDQARILAGAREVAFGADGAGRLMVLGDADRLKQVLLILLDNALKYGRQTDDGWVRAQVWRDGSAAYVGVSDNGEGIAPDDAPHIFDRFYRAQRAAQHRLAAQHASAGTDGRTYEREVSAEPDEQRSLTRLARQPQQREGSGLGLAIAQAIIHAHGGAITVQSQQGVGTTFTITLPLAQGARQAMV